MRILPYYVIHTFINSIKKLFKTWVAIFLAICLGFGIIGGIVGVAIGSAIPDEADTAIEEVIEEEDEDIPLTDEEKQDILSLCRGGIILIVLFVILMSIYGGDKSGTKIFTMPDVNFLFASPIKPQSVLMFRTVLQMGIAIISSVYILFQLPNLVLNLGLSIFACISIFLAYAFLLYYSRLASVLTYTLTATYRKIKPLVRPFVIGIFVILAAIYLGFVKIGQLDYFTAAVNMFSNSALEYIPVFGWIAGMIMSAVSGNITGFVFYILLTAVASIGLTVLIWKIPADFYEDALSDANQQQEVLNAAKTGETVKRKKERSAKISRNTEFTGDGAAAFFTKTVYNRKRFAKFGILTATSGTYALISLGLTAALSIVFDFKSVIPLGFVIFTCIFFRNMGNPKANETAKDFIYLVPEPPAKKLFYCMAGCVYETALDILPAFIIAAITIPNAIPNLILWYLVWLTFDIFCSSVGLFTELAIPAAVVPTIKAMLGIFIRMAAIIPALIMLIIGGAANMPLMFILTALLNIGVSALLFWLSSLFLHAGKK